MSTDKDLSQKISFFDKARLRVIFNNDETTINNFVEIFVNETKNSLNEIADAIHRKDVSLAHNIAHRLKGSSGTSGAISMHELVIQLEKEILQKNWAQAKKLHQDLVILLKTIE